MKNRKRAAIKTDLFAHEAHHQKLDELGDPLQEIERHVDFATLAARVDESVPRPDRTKGGRPPYPTETMVRILVLKRLYNLSDEQMEYQLLDRMSYKRFCGLDDALRVPDRTTIWHFENRVGQAGAQALFGEMAEQLARKGFIARGGQIIDATLVKAPVQRNSRQENEQVRQGNVPEDWNDARRRQKDVDASWTKEVPAAIAKGVEEAKKHFFRVPLIQRTIPHPVQGEKAAGVVLLRPASAGTGVIAGGSARAVLECAGVQDVLAKSLGSANAINVVHATVDALKRLEDPEAVARRRGLPVEDVAPAALLRARKEEVAN